MSDKIIFDEEIRRVMTAMEEMIFEITKAQLSVSTNLVMPTDALKDLRSVAQRLLEKEERQVEDKVLAWIEIYKSIDEQE